ncbi:hypothetical protein [Pseudonocardia sp. TRM90224]|uniref:hypothetical protein n=1 Tax=Pseudonocardia sp. TRM90224 TaxID=2812678 RepID=UPI001E35EE1C|nr:hypothetical protein [Pseudonocardia sp. TRM90224]
MPALVAETFTRQLSRPVTVEETGLGGAQPDEHGQPADGGLARLDVLAPAGAEPDLLAGSIYHLDALCVPDWMQSPRDPLQTGAASPGSASELDAALMLCEVFSAADAMRGGRHARAALGAYLGTSISRWRPGDAPGTVRRRMLAAAAKLTYLYAFMCFDEGLHGLAQRFYLTSANLSTASGDRKGYAIALRALSVQARYLGHLTEAVDLAERSVRSVASPPDEPRVQAFLYGQLAVAHAAVGDGRRALGDLAMAERQLDQTGAENAPIGAYHAGSLAHQHAAVAAFLGDRQAAVSALQVSLRHRPTTERRSRAILRARLAELQLAGGNLDAACDTWMLFLDDYQHISSKRADSALATMHALVLPHQHHPPVKRLRHTAASVSIRRSA